jgi:hypothetical protein
MILVVFYRVGLESSSLLNDFIIMSICGGVFVLKSFDYF